MNNFSFVFYNKISMNARSGFKESVVVKFVIFFSTTGMTFLMVCNLFLMAIKRLLLSVDAAIRSKQMKITTR